MSTTIKIKRGLKTNLPTLSEGELAYCTDTNELFIGTVSGNELVNQDLDTDEYIVSGTFDDETGDLVLTRSDSQDITINLDGRYLQTFTDTNDFVTSADFTNGTLTLTRTDTGTITVSLDGRYLQSFTETDPTVPAHVKAITTTNINNWDTAYGWGDHANEGYLTSFTETDPVFLAQKGQANGVATLDANSKVPAAQLPSYVDDVLEFADLASFPATGETGKIYVTLDTNKTYRWTGSAYVEISASLVPNNGTLTLATSGIATGDQTFTADQTTNATFTVDVPGTDLGSSGTGGTRTITSSTGNDTTITYNASDVGAATAQFYTTTIATTDWSGTDPVTAVKTVSGVLSTDQPLIDIDLSAVTFADVEDKQTEYAKLFRVAATDANEITFFATETPTEELVINIKVVR
jgi:hypothetical protein